uniref:Uncharacterized protein n=1 Tax=Cyprinus carpio carpio TaxID=630221 RepID=A0A9J7X381_CYPCA
MLSHSCLIQASSCSTVLGLLCRIFPFMMRQIFSMGERSGLQAGHFSTRILLPRSHDVVTDTKEDKDNPSCYQRSVQKLASLMVWGCMSACGMGSLHILKGTINAERYIQVLEQHMLPSRRCLFQGRPCIFQHDNARQHSYS